LRVAFVLKGYPRLSETFIAQEIAALEKRGLDILIVSLRRPTDGALHPVHREIKAEVLYLPEYLLLEPIRVVRAFFKTKNIGKAAKVWLKDLLRDPTPNRIRRFGQALVLAAEAPKDITRLHAHFLHTPASVARYAALLRGLPWSGSAHAKDIWTIPEWEKREKLAAAAEARAEPLRSGERRLDVRGLRVEELLREVDRFLDSLYGEGAAECVVLHGHGTGALKQALRDHLGASPYVAGFRPGEDHEGGDAVTVVSLRR